jgi:hypothetical protein
MRPRKLSLDFTAALQTLKIIRKPANAFEDERLYLELCQPKSRATTRLMIVQQRDSSYARAYEALIGLLRSIR